MFAFAAVFNVVVFVVVCLWLFLSHNDNDCMLFAHFLMMLMGGTVCLGTDNGGVDSSVYVYRN